MVGRRSRGKQGDESRENETSEKVHTRASLLLLAPEKYDEMRKEGVSKRKKGNRVEGRRVERRGRESAKDSKTKRETRTHS